jgi:aspartyl-tRNA(Asn)/glutamyl-tRNA(Gln) amidotransferase subunit C
MAITQKDVRHIMGLARLKLPDEAVAPLLHDLEAILVHVDALAQVNVDGVQALTHAVPVQQPMRPDEVQPSLGVTGLEGSAGVEGRFIKVPRIME